MAKPPETPPHSDIEGVNRDARAGKAPNRPHPDAGGALDRADKESRARPARSGRQAGG